MTKGYDPIRCVGKNHPRGFHHEGYAEYLQKKAERRAKKLGARAAKKMIANPTRSEVLCMAALGSIGVKFIFQKPVVFQSHPTYRILDFFIPDIFVAIEVDGSGHFTDKGKIRDALREQQFKSEYPHFRFLRYTNEEVHNCKFADRLKTDLESME